MATETLTSALLAYRDLAPIFMIRAVVKTWKTSYRLASMVCANTLRQSRCANAPIRMRQSANPPIRQSANPPIRQSAVARHT